MSVRPDAQDEPATKVSKTDSLDSVSPKTFIVVYTENLDCSSRLESFSNESDLVKSLKRYILDCIEPLYTDDEEFLELLEDIEEWSTETTKKFALSHGEDPMRMNEDGNMYRFWTLQAIIEGRDMTFDTP